MLPTRNYFVVFAKSSTYYSLLIFQALGFVLVFDMNRAERTYFDELREGDVAK